MQDSYVIYIFRKEYEKFILHGMSHYKIGRLVVELHKPADSYHLQINFYPLLFLLQDK